MTDFDNSPVTDIPVGFDALYEVYENDHTKLSGRDADDQHPIEAITGLSDALSDLTDKTDGLADDVEALTDTVAGKADTDALSDVAFSGAYGDLSGCPTIPTTGSSEGLQKGDGSGGLTEAVPGTDYQRPYTAETVTLRANAWTVDLQNVAVTGVKTGDLLLVSPARTDAADYAASAVAADTVPFDGVVTFRCDSQRVPARDLSVRVVIFP